MGSWSQQIHQAFLRIYALRSTPFYLIGALAPLLIRKRYVRKIATVLEY